MQHEIKRVADVGDVLVELPSGEKTWVSASEGIMKTIVQSTYELCEKNLSLLSDNDLKTILKLAAKEMRSPHENVLANLVFKVGTDLLLKRSNKENEC